MKSKLLMIVLSLLLLVYPIEIVSANDISVNDEIVKSEKALTVNNINELPNAWNIRNIYTDEITIEEINRFCEYFGKLSTEVSVEPLYDLFGAPTFLLATFTDTGYAIMLRSTGVILEYNLFSQSPWANITGKKCYAGPMRYFSEEKNVYTDLLTNNVLDDKVRQNSRPILDSFIARSIHKLENYFRTAANTTNNTSGDRPYEYLINDWGYIYNDLPFGTNSNGTCGPLASSMLLTYYDDKVNDLFVREELECNASNPDGLHHKLIKLTDLTFGGTIPRDDWAGINRYLGENKTTRLLGFEAHESFLSALDTMNVIRMMKNQRPVMLYLADLLGSDFGNHVTLGYGYISASEYENPYKYIVHLGWKTSNDPNVDPRRAVVDCEFTSGAVWLEEYASHTHDFSKLRDILTDRDGERVHDFMCTGCYLMERNPHSFIWLGESPYIHFYKCACGIREITCDGSLVEDYNDTSHFLRCSKNCGYITDTNEHNYSFVSNGSSGHSLKCTLCGYIDFTASHTGISCTFCGYTHEEHTAGTTWETNATQHWKTCTFSGCDYKLNTGTHSETANCSTCGRQHTIHQYNSSWTITSTEHWKVCSISGCTSKGLNGTHNEYSNCATCGRQHTIHTYKATWSYDSSKHWKECIVSGCSSKDSNEGHTYGSGTVCTICGKTHEHIANSSWVFDSSQHWKPCSISGCSYKCEQGNHNYGTGTSCTMACGKTHEHSCPAWEKNDAQHWKPCITSGCSYKSQYNYHSYGTGTSCTSGCGKTHVHAPRSTLSKDTAQHWNACTTSGCSFKFNLAYHDYGTGTTCRTVGCGQTHIHASTAAWTNYDLAYHRRTCSTQGCSYIFSQAHFLARPTDNTCGGCGRPGPFAQPQVAPNDPN